MNHPLMQLHGLLRSRQAQIEWPVGEGRWRGCAVSSRNTARSKGRDLQADGYVVRREDLAQLSPYQTRRLKRFGDYTLSMSTPDPFDTDLVVPFPLEVPESAATA